MGSLWVGLPAVGSVSATTDVNEDGSFEDNFIIDIIIGTVYEWECEYVIRFFSD